MGKRLKDIRVVGRGKHRRPHGEETGRTVMEGGKRRQRKKKKAVVCLIKNQAPNS